MPEVVRREVVVRRPLVLARLEPLDALLDLAAHLVSVKAGVHRPAVGRLDRERALGGRDRLVVLIALLESERVEAEHVRVPRHVGRPLGQHARDAVAQVQRVAAQEVEQMRGLERDRVARVRDEDAIEQRRGAAPVAVDQPAQGDGVHPLAIVGGAALDEAFERREAGARQLEEARLAVDGEHGRLEGVTEREVGARFERAIDRGERVTSVALELPDRLLEQGEAGGIGMRDGFSAKVGGTHGGGVLGCLPRGVPPRGTTRSLR